MKEIDAFNTVADPQNGNAADNAPPLAPTIGRNPSSQIDKPSIDADDDTKLLPASHLQEKIKRKDKSKTSRRNI